MSATPRVFVTPEWLNEQRRARDTGLVIIDASLLRTEAADGTYIFSDGAEQFRDDGHIPGARHADLIAAFSDQSSGLPFTRPTAGAFESAARAVGVDDEATVVVYDRLNNAWAARLWLLLTSFGHESTYVLNGGLTAWSASGNPIEYGAPIGGTGNFTAVDGTADFADLSEVAAVVDGHDSTTLINVLDPEVYAGREQHYARAGRIPSSVNDPFEALIDPASNRLDFRRSILPEPDPNAHSIAYCGGGIYASGYVAALREVSETDVRVYDGSLTEWATREPLLPLAVDPQSDGERAPRDA